MMIDDARRELPIWANTDYTDSNIRIYQPEKKRTQKKDPERPVRMIAEEKLQKFWKRRGIALMAAVGLTVWTLVTCGITGTIVRHNTTVEVTEAVTTELRAGFQAYLAEAEQKRVAEGLLTGDASKEAAIADMADHLDNLIATYRMDLGVTEQGAYGVGWCVIARMETGGWYGNGIDGVLNKAGQWEGNFAEHAVRNEDTAIARQIAEDYYNGVYPDGFTADLVYMNREANGNVVLRNEYQTGPNTVYWRYSK